MKRELVLDYFHLRKQQCPASLNKVPAGAKRREGIPDAPPGRSGSPACEGFELRSRVDGCPPSRLGCAHAYPSCIESEQLEEGAHPLEPVFADRETVGSAPWAPPAPAPSAPSAPSAPAPSAPSAPPAPPAPSSRNCCLLLAHCQREDDARRRLFDLHGVGTDREHPEAPREPILPPSGRTAGRVRTRPRSAADRPRPGPRRSLPTGGRRPMRRRPGRSRWKGPAGRPVTGGLPGPVAARRSGTGSWQGETARAWRPVVPGAARDRSRCSRPGGRFPRRRRPQAAATAEGQVHARGAADQPPRDYHEPSDRHEVADVHSDKILTRKPAGRRAPAASSIPGSLTTPMLAIESPFTVEGTARMNRTTPASGERASKSSSRGSPSRNRPASPSPRTSRA